MLFADESYWRDIVAFTWNITTVAGVAGLLRAVLEKIEPTGFRVTEEPVASRRPKGVRHGAFRDRVTWADNRVRESAELGCTVLPEVLVTGGDQDGTAFGARLRRLGVPTAQLDPPTR